MKILELQDLHKNFKGLTVLREVNLSLEQGQCHAVIGPNGAGKSTLFNVITGKYKPSQGRVLFCGEDITGLSPHRISETMQGSERPIWGKKPMLELSNVNTYYDKQGFSRAVSNRC